MAKPEEALHPEVDTPEDVEGPVVSSVETDKSKKMRVGSGRELIVPDRELCSRDAIVNDRLCTRDREVRDEDRADAKKIDTGRDRDAAREILGMDGFWIRPDKSAVGKD